LALSVAALIFPASSKAVSLLAPSNDPTFQTQGSRVDSTGLLGTGPWSGTSNFPALNGITGTGPTVVVGNGNASVEGLSTESNGRPISSFGAIFQTLNTNYTKDTIYTLTLNITFNVPLSANPLTADNIGIALTAGGSQTSPGSIIIASSLAPNASTVVTATPGFLAENVTLQFSNGNSTPNGKLGIEFFAGADGFLNPNTVYPVNNVEFNNLSLTSSPVPEPSILGLLGAGLASIMVLRVASHFVRSKENLHRGCTSRP
jgi:hypothetical protein